MLHILLWILKIVGILLAVLFGILLFGLICVLFVPVRYRIEADGKAGGEYPVRAEVKVSWLLHIISAAFTYREAARIRIKIFCFTIFDSAKSKKSEKSEKSEKPETKKQGEKKGKKKNSTASDTAGEDRAKEDKTREDNVKEDREKEDKGIEDKGIEDKGIEAGSSLQTGAGETKHTEQEDAEGIAKDGEENKRGIKAFFQVLRHFLERLLAALKNIEYTIKKICDKIKKVMENIQYYTEVLKSEAFRGAWEVSKKQLLKILWMLRPRTCSIHLLAGTGDPAGTGQLLAFYGILYPFIGNYVSVEADFENKVMEGSLFIRGRITMFVFLTAAFQLFVNKNIRRLLKMIKKEDM